MSEPICPKCNCEHTYQDGNFWVCPECSHEWNPKDKLHAESSETKDASVKDAHGNGLKTGDAIVVIKDLKVKGSSSVVKGGTKIKNIRIIDSTDGHNIACRIEGVGAMNLKSEFVKKSN